MKIAKTTNQLRKKGFTLIEVIIVIAILGTLTAVAVPSYNALQNNSTAKVCAETRQAFVNQLVSDRKLDGTDVNQNFKTLSDAGTYKCPGNGTYTISSSTDKTFTINCSEHGATSGEFTGDMTLIGSAAGSAVTEVPKESVVDPTTPTPSEPEPPETDKIYLENPKEEKKVKLDSSYTWPTDPGGSGSTPVNLKAGGVFAYPKNTTNYYVVTANIGWMSNDAIRNGPENFSDKWQVVKLSDFATQQPFPVVKKGDKCVTREGGFSYWPSPVEENNCIHHGDIVRDDENNLYILRTGTVENSAADSISNTGMWYKIPNVEYGQ